MTMGFLLSCFCVFIKMKIQQSRHSPSTQLVLGKFLCKSDVLLMSQFSMEGKFDFSPNLGINPLFRSFHFIDKLLNSRLTVMNEYLLNLTYPVRSILWKEQIYMLNGFISVIKPLACLNIIELTPRTIGDSTNRIPR